MATIQDIATGIAGLLGRPQSDGWAFWRCARNNHLVPLGKAGRGGVGAVVADTPQAVLLLLAMTWGGGVRESLTQASETYALSFRDAVRNFVCVDRIVPVLWDNQPETLKGSNFGAAVGAFINAYRAGLALEDWIVDPAAKPHRLHFGTADGVPFGRVERRSSELNEDGHIVIDEFNYVSAPVTVARVERSVSLLIDLLADVAKILGPLAASSSGGGLRLVWPPVVDEDEESDGGNRHRRCGDR
jgi:hypothetical protein